MENLYIKYKIELATTSSFLPLKTYKDLSRPEELKIELNKIGGVYGFIHLPDNKQYTGSISDLYKRLNIQLKGISSNIRLQRAISKSGLNSFIFVIYHFHNNPNILLTDIETAIIKSFPFENLYNFKKEAFSMLNYKQTAKAIENLKKRFFNKKIILCLVRNILSLTPDPLSLPLFLLKKIRGCFARVRGKGGSFKVY